MDQLAALLLLALVVPLPVYAQCPAGAVAAPASFDTIIQPALAVDTNPSPDVVEVFLTAREAVVDYGTGNMTPVWTYNGIVPGPTIEAVVGNTLIVNFCNDLPEETTIHWHGLETPANMDGSNISQLTVPPRGGTFRYEFPLLVAGTFWYHPHIRSNRQIELGLHAALIVRDPVEDAALALPTREHVFVLDDVLLNADGQIIEAFAGSKETVALEALNGREGNVTLFNGVLQPSVSMERGVPHRIRVINVANARVMRMSVSGHSFWRIGGDQGLLEQPIEVPPAFDGGSSSDTHANTGLFLTPGERADVIFVPTGLSSLLFQWHDTRRGRQSVEFSSDGATVTLGHDLPDGTLPWLVYAQIDLFGENEPTWTPPARLRNIQRIDTTGAPVLQLVVGHTLPDWNTGEVTSFIQGLGLPFDKVTPEVAHRVKANGTYVWEVKNLTQLLHNFHPHGWSFQHIETEFMDTANPGDPTLNYVVPATHLENKDTIGLPPRSVVGTSLTISRFAVTFTDAGREGRVAAAGKEPETQRSGGWLVHCHFLEHAAVGMMSFFQVIE